MKRILPLLDFINETFGVSGTELPETDEIFEKIDEEKDPDIRLKLLEYLVQKTQAYIQKNGLEESLYEQTKERFNHLREKAKDEMIEYSDDDRYKSWLRHLPSKRMGSGVLIMNDEDQFLGVCPSYKATYEIPGGVVEDNESPREACLREVKEELGIELDRCDFLTVEYRHESGQRTEGIMWVYTCHIDDVIGDLKVDGSEVTEYRWLSESEIDKFYSSENLATRIRLSLQCYRKGTVGHIEDGALIG